MFSKAALFAACITAANAFSPIAFTQTKLRHHAPTATGSVYTWLPATRKDFTSLNDDELDKLGHAFNTLYDNGVIEKFAELHQDYFENGIHWGPVFLPWHRDFLRKMELKLQSVEPSVSLPYWDWTNNDSKSLDVGKWKSFFGGRSNTDGKFDNWNYGRLARDPDPSETQPPLPQTHDVLAEIAKEDYLGIRGCEGTIHVPAHVWTGGTMNTPTSPRDPLFYLHHCNIDRIWAIWQLNHDSEVQYTNRGTVRSDRSSAVLSKTDIDSFMVTFDSDTTEILGTTPAMTPRSVLDHTSLGYDYPIDNELEDRWAMKMKMGDKPLITGSAQTLAVKGISDPDIDLEGGRFCTLDVNKLINIIGHRKWIKKDANVNSPLTASAGIKGNQGTVLRVRNERTNREGGLLLWSNGSEAYACWNPTEYTKSDDWSIGDVMTLLDFPHHCTKKLASVASYRKVSETGWNLNADCIRFGQCGLVGPWWKEMEIEYELLEGDDSITGIWTDSSVELPYTIKYYQEDGDKWAVFRDNCRGSVFDKELSEVKATKWRLQWASTDLFQTKGLSTYRSGGGLHAELLS